MSALKHIWPSIDLPSVCDGTPPHPSQYDICVIGTAEKDVR